MKDYNAPETPLDPRLEEYTARIGDIEGEVNRTVGELVALGEHPDADVLERMRADLSRRMLAAVERQEEAKMLGPATGYYVELPTTRTQRARIRLAHAVHHGFRGVLSALYRFSDWQHEGGLSVPVQRLQAKAFDLIAPDFHSFHRWEPYPYPKCLLCGKCTDPTIDDVPLCECNGAPWKEL